MTRIITAQQSRLLFYTLTANGAFSAVSGLIFVLQAQPLAAWTGLSQPIWLTGIGTMLILFGARLLWLGRRKSVHQWEALLISGLDLGWVVITVGLAVGVPGLFTLAGVYAVCAVALIVLTFLDLQLYALWKCRV
ncbi:MAG: hypothetical protein WD750_04190 [Gammaproteobacteria bacterium]